MRIKFRASAMHPIICIPTGWMLEGGVDLEEETVK
jgi:hypothetical protein